LPQAQKGFQFASKKLGAINYLHKHNMPGVDIETKDLIVSNSQTGRVSPLVAAA
jgi:hypothetical protein